MAGVLIVSKRGDKGVGKAFDLVAGYHPNNKIILLSKGIAPNTKANHIRFSIENNVTDANLNKVEDFGYSYLYLHGFDDDEVIPSSILIDAYSKNTKAIVRITDSFERKPYEPFKSLTSKVLLVFPGPIIPLSMGSHQRAFNLVYNLNLNGVGVDVLVTAGNGQQLNTLKKLLLGIAPKVHTYKNNRKKLSRVMRFRKGAEKYWRRLYGRINATPDLFEERLYNKPTHSGKVTLANLLEKSNKYSDVIISYGWLEPMRSFVSSATISSINWICDTHDVQYIRGITNNKGERRLFVSYKREKKLELNVLSKFNSVLAISDADRRTLLKDSPSLNVISCPTGFDYAYAKIKKHTNKPYTFGFIGGKMDANIKSLELVLKEWWPEIFRFSPSSKFLIAGSICNVSRIQELCFFNESVELLGFVDSLKRFYSSIDVLLNPVLVQGGLNFKSVEAVAAGKHLFTNSLGVACLRDSKMAFVCDKKETVTKNLAKLEGDVEYDVAMRRSAQKRAFAIFADSIVYKGLIEVLHA